VKIRVAENFNNVEYATNKIEFQISDPTLQFTNAILRVESSLHGIRYLMRRWFYSFAFFAISGMTAGIFISVLSCAVVLQTNAKLLIEKIQ
jgi:hypothetical protein